MSGIAGVISKESKNNAHQLSEISKLQVNYSPDLTRSFVSDSSFCGMSQTGSGLLDTLNPTKYPFQSKDGNHTLVYNGEVYNYLEVKDTLQKEGVEFATSSEIEVILQSFIFWGEKCVERLNGQFTFAIWDEIQEQVFLVRDRIGINPLFYAFVGGTLYFSSEMKAITPFIDKKNWNETAIQYYFRLGYIPSPHTIYKQINKLEEGAFLKVDFETGLQQNDGTPQFEIKKYWTLESKIEKEIISDEEKAKKELHDLLTSSVKMRLQKDVPFGVLLSGGIDSSTIAAISQSLSDKPVPTFSIGFKEASHNESHFAKQVSEKLGTEHHEFILSHKDIQNLIPEIPKWYEQPYADSSAFPTFLISKMASEKAKYVLTGDGGDEQFMGYGMYTWADRLTSLKNSRWLIKTALNLSPKVNHKRASQYFDLAADEHLAMHVFSVDQALFSAKQIQICFTFSSEFVNFNLDKTKRRLLASEEQSLYDLKYYMPGDLTVKVERAMLQNKIDARAPLLDHRIIEWAINLDEKLKRKNGINKYLLKQVLYKYLPESLFDRPKWGFGIPLSKWLGKELKPLLDQYVNAETLKQFPFYNVEEILEIKKQYLSGKTYLYNQLWLVIVFNMWAEDI